MSWRWLVNGLGGLVGMMLHTFTEQMPIEREHFDKLNTLIEQLQELRDQLRHRDMKG